MGPPSFKDFGDDAEDLLNKKFFFDSFKLEVESKVGGVGITTNLDHNTNTKKLASSINSKIKFKDYKMKILPSWSSSNIVDADICVKNILTKGLKHKLNITYDYFNKCQHATLVNTLKHKDVRMDIDLNFKQSIPTIAPSFVVKHQGYMAGVDLCLNAVDKEVSQANFAVGYDVKHFTFCGLISDWGKRYTASVFQKISDTVEAAASITWSRDANDISWAVGAEVQPDEKKKHKLKAKIDHLNQLSVAYTMYLTKDAKMTICSQLSSKDNPKLGLGLDLEM